MTGARNQFPDRTSVPSKTEARVTAAVPPSAAVTPLSNPTLTGVASVTSAAPGLSPPVSQVGPGAADFSSPTVSATRSVDDLGSVQDALKMSTDGHHCAGGNPASTQRDIEQESVTAGETAPNSRDGASVRPVTGLSETAQIGSLAVTARRDERPFSNSGDGLGIHELGSMTRGGDTVAAAPSGMACLHAKCPAVTGSLSEPASNPPAPALAGLTSVGLAFSSDCIGHIGDDLEAAICALEVSWLRCGIIMNHMTLRSCALSETDASMRCIKPDATAPVIPIENANNIATGKHHAD